MAIHEGYLIRESEKRPGEPCKFCGEIGLILKSEPDAPYSVYTQGSEKAATREAIILFAENIADFEKIESFEQAAGQLTKNEAVVVRIGNLKVFQLYKTEPVPS